MEARSYHKASCKSAFRREHCYLCRRGWHNPVSILHRPPFPSEYMLAQSLSCRYKHPYEAEILSMTYPERVFQSAEPIPSQPVETTNATWVDTYEGVLKMLEELKKAKEIAVDLEHHDFRTYVGLVSLMQISTRDQDWIVDTLKPWRHKLEVLNEVFADSSIVKVCKSSTPMDIVAHSIYRSSTARTWIWSGFNEISDSTSMAYLIRILRANFFSIPAGAWHFFSQNSSISMPINNINWLTGE